MRNQRTHQISQIKIIKLDYNKNKKNRNRKMKKIKIN